MKKFAYRICHLAKYYPPIPGGIETHVQTLVQAQADLGANVSVLCVNGVMNSSSQFTATRTITEFDRGVKITRLGRIACIARFDVCPAFFRQLWSIINSPYDIIHLHTPNPTMLVAWLITGAIAFLLRRPRPLLAITHHSDIIRQRFLKYAIRPLEWMVYHQAACILTTSTRYIDGSKFLNVYREKLWSLPLGIDCSHYKQPSDSALSFARHLQKTYGSPIWLAVGRLVYYKALHIAIQALAQVPGTLVVIGTGSMEKPLRTLANQLGVGQRIVWCGRATPDELVGAYYAATALWFPSNVRSEGFGIVQVEAMVCGCPVINTDIPGSGVPWVSRHEQEGLTIPINDPDALVHASQRLLQEPGLRDRLSKASRERGAKFDYHLMAQQSFEIYEQVLKRSPLKPQLEPLQVE